MEYGTRRKAITHILCKMCPNLVPVQHLQQHIIAHDSRPLSKSQANLLISLLQRESKRPRVSS